MRYTISIAFFITLLSGALLAQPKTRLPESGVEVGFAVTPVQMNPFTPVGFSPAGSSKFFFDPIPEFYLKVPLKGIKLRGSYDYSSLTGNHLSSDAVLNRLDGTYTQHTFAAGVERIFRIGRKKFYLFGDLRYTWAWFSGSLYYGTGVPATTVEAEVAMSGLGAAAGIGWKYNITGRLDFFAETAIAADRIILTDNDIFLDGTNILPRFISAGFIYRFEKLYDCNCPDNTIRR